MFSLTGASCLMSPSSHVAACRSASAEVFRGLCEHSGAFLRGPPYLCQQRGCASLRVSVCSPRGGRCGSGLVTPLTPHGLETQGPRRAPCVSFLLLRVSALLALCLTTVASQAGSSLGEGVRAQRAGLHHFLSHPEAEGLGVARSPWLLLLSAWASRRASIRFLVSAVVWGL